MSLNPQVFRGICQNKYGRMRALANPLAHLQPARTRRGFQERLRVRSVCKVFSRLLSPPQSHPFHQSLLCAIMKAGPLLHISSGARRGDKAGR